MPIEVKNVDYIYGKGSPFEVFALKDVSFTVKNGERLGIMGHTGSGKSTVIQLIAGLLAPSAGSVLVDSRNINDKHYDRSELREKVGLVFQYPECQLFETTVEKDVAFGLKHSGLSKSEVSERVKWALDVTGFDFQKVRGQPPVGLSGGEKRRVAIAGVLAARPKYLILDEPIAGLDPLGREAFLKLADALCTDGMTILMVSHNADSLGEFAERILVFDNGSLVKDGPTRDVFSDMGFMMSRHLGVGDCCELAHMLNARGFDIPVDITRYDRLFPAVLSAVSGGGAV